MVLALAAAFTSANAQVKSISAATSALEKAKAETENPKKADKTATWIKYGQALTNAYDSPAGDGWIGASRQELQLLSGSEKPSAVESVVLAGQAFEKEVYSTRNYYYTPNAAGQAVLSMVEVTKPIDADALGKAIDAYATAAKLDAKGTKTKDINAALQSINTKLVEKAYTEYTLGDLAAASVDFEKAAKALGTFPLSKLDTNSLYNAAFTAWIAQDNARAQKLFQKCYDNGYYAQDGEVFAKLADIAAKEGNDDKSRDILEEGFQKFPQSQSILVGLINYYLTNNGSTDRLFELLSIAKNNEPNNPSLYYVEGNIRKQLGMNEEALAAYRQCAEIDPSYAYGYIGEGIFWYETALKYQEEAQNEMDYRKYEALDAKFVESLKSCIPAFEKALELINDDTTKVGVAEYLKNACFRFRAEEGYAEKYEKYAAIVAGK